mgnify:CR=1 FL=1
MTTVSRSALPWLWLATLLLGARFVLRDTHGGGGNLVVTGNNANQTGTGITQTGAITDNVVGGNITFRSNNNINQTGAVTMVSNPGTTAAVLTYDVSTGNSTSSIVAGSLTITGTNTGPIDYNLFAAGAQLIPGAISVPGTITLDNTYGGTSGVGGAPTSGYITASNLSLATTNIGIVVDSALSANRGVVIRGASYGGTNTMGIRIWSNITSSQGNIDLTGFTQSGRAISSRRRVVVSPRNSASKYWSIRARLAEAMPLRKNGAKSEPRTCSMLV